MSTLLQFFGYAHLPPRLQAVSKVFWDTAEHIVQMTPKQVEAEIERRKDYQGSSVFALLSGTVDRALPANPEATWAVIKINEAADMFVAGDPTDNVLRRLLEAKDCAVRAVLYRRVG